MSRFVKVMFLLPTGSMDMSILSTLSITNMIMCSIQITIVMKLLM